MTDFNDCIRKFSSKPLGDNSSTCDLFTRKNRGSKSGEHNPVSKMEINSLIALKYWKTTAPTIIWTFSMLSAMNKDKALLANCVPGNLGSLPLKQNQHEWKY